jgi:hypothetical protein
MLFLDKLFTENTGSKIASRRINWTEKYLLSQIVWVGLCRCESNRLSEFQFLLRDEFWQKFKGRILFSPDIEVSISKLSHQWSFEVNLGSARVNCQLNFCRVVDKLLDIQCYAIIKQLLCFRKDFF